MLVWIMIIISLLFAWMGFKKGFMLMFAMLFNLMFAVFIAVLSTPKLLTYSSGYEDSGYYAAASVFLMFVLIFGLLQIFSWYYFLRDTDDLFPKLLDKVGAVLTGFICGYVVSSLLVLSVCIMPCSARMKIGWLCTRDSMCELSRPAVRKVCNFLAWYSLHCFRGDSEEAIDKLLALHEQDHADKMLNSENSSWESPDTSTLPEEDLLSRPALDL